MIRGYTKLECIAMGLSVFDINHHGYLNHISLVNAKSSRGILSIWPGTYDIENLVTSSCSQKLAYMVFSQVTATFINCIFNDGLVVSDVSTSQCKTTDTITIIDMQCSFNQKCITCIKKSLISSKIAKSALLVVTTQCSK